MRCPPNLPQYGWYLGYPWLDLERGGAELRLVPPQPRHPRHHVWEVPHQTYRPCHGAHTLDDWYLVWPHCAESHRYPTMIFRQEWSPSSPESRIWILPFFEGDHLSPFYWSCRMTPMLITPGPRQDGGDECVWWQSSSGQGGERCQCHDQCSSLLPQALEPVIIQGHLYLYLY